MSIENFSIDRIRNSSKVVYKKQSNTSETQDLAITFNRLNGN